MKQTVNLGLNKPDGNDTVNIELLNENMDTLDTAIKQTKDAIKDITFDSINSKPGTYPPSEHTHSQYLTD